MIKLYQVVLNQKNIKRSITINMYKQEFRGQGDSLLYSSFHIDCDSNAIQMVVNDSNAPFELNVPPLLRTSRLLDSSLLVMTAM